MPTKEEEDKMYADAAVAAAEKAREAEARGETVDLDKLAALTVEVFGHGKANLEEVVRAVRPKATDIYVQALTGNEKERFDARRSLFGKRYKLSKDEAKNRLNTVWKITDKNGVAPKDFESLVNGSTRLQHNAVALELTANLVSFSYKKEIAENPRFWWSEVERAYQSIDFRNLPPEEEAELRLVFERSFKHMRDIAAKDPDMAVKFPADDKTLWRGLGDYYFSEPIDFVAGESTPIKTQKELLKARIKKFQYERSRPHDSEAEKRLLNKFVEDLNNGLDHDWKDLTVYIDDIANRAANEAQEFSKEGGVGTGRDRDTSAAKKAEAWEKIDVLGEFKAHGGGFEYAPTAGMFASSEDAMKGLFDEDKWLPVRSKFTELAEMFKMNDTFEAFNFDDQGKLKSARSELDNLMKSYGDGMSPEQKAVLQRYSSQVDSEFNSLLNRERAPNAIYLSEDIQTGVEQNPIGMTNDLYNFAIEAYIENPDSPITKFYFKQLELVEFYLFSPQHSKLMLDRDVFLIRGTQAELHEALKEGKSVDVRKLSKQEVETKRARIDEAIRKNAEARGLRGEALEGEKAKFARELKIRLLDAQFIQIWQHTPEANDEQFQRFLNGRMNEDSYWGIDGLYGGLVERFRMEMRRQYEMRLFNAHGDMNGHVDTLWKDAYNATREKMKHDKVSIRMYKDYLNGEFFKEMPYDGVTSVLRGTPLTDEQAEVEYEKAYKVINEFANMRMLMSVEKENIDIRFRPTKDGVNYGDIDLDTQFKEKQKLAKLMRRYGGWQKTWGGVTQGDAIERNEMNRMSEHVRIVYPEIDKWADERTNDFWVKMQKYLNMKDEDIKGDDFYEFRRLYGEIQSVFEYAWDVRDKVPKWSNMEEAKKYLRYEMSKSRLRQMCRVDSALQVADMHMLVPYTMVSESGARRAAQMGILKQMLGGPDNEARAAELAKQNFLGHMQLEAGIGYFMTIKSTADTPHNKKKLIDGIGYINKYRPQSVLLTLREGGNKKLDGWLAKGDFGGKQGFAKYYEELDTIHEDLFEQFFLRDQIDYTEGYGGLIHDARVDQKQIVDAYFTDKFGAEAQSKKDWYFTEMKKVADKCVEAIPDMTDIRYGPLLTKMRWDDYPFELLQYPERAIPILMQVGPGGGAAAHPLYEAGFAPAKAAYERAATAHQQAQYGYAQAKQQNLPASQIQAKKAELAAREKTMAETAAAMNRMLRQKFELIRKNEHMTSMYLTKATDHNEPQAAHDEQSGLWRRMWRDLGADANLFAIWGQALGLDSHEAPKAMKQIHHTLVGVQGDDIAQINHLMILAAKLGVQEVYKNYGTLLAGLPHSAPIKYNESGATVYAPDAINHMFEEGLALGSGRAGPQAPGAEGFEFAAKKFLRTTNWNGILGGMHKRAELIENLREKFPFMRSFLSEKSVDELVDLLDLHAPLGVWKSKLLPIGIAAIIFLIAYAGTQAGGEEKKKN